MFSYGLKKAEPSPMSRLWNSGISSDEILVGVVVTTKRNKEVPVGNPKELSLLITHFWWGHL